MGFSFPSHVNVRWATSLRIWHPSSDSICLPWNARLTEDIVTHFWPLYATKVRIPPYHHHFRYRSYLEGLYCHLLRSSAEKDRQIQDTFSPSAIREQKTDSCSVLVDYRISLLCSCWFEERVQKWQDQYLQQGQQKPRRSEQLWQPINSITKMAWRQINLSHYASVPTLI